jgi:hypothetical protein
MARNHFYDDFGVKCDEMKKKREMRPYLLFMMIETS